jgi:hypothetical protein
MIVKRRLESVLEASSHHDACCLQVGTLGARATYATAGLRVVALTVIGSASMRVITVWLDGWDGDWPMWHDEKC